MQPDDVDQSTIHRVELDRTPVAHSSTWRGPRWLGQVLVCAVGSVRFYVVGATFWVTYCRTDNVEHLHRCISSWQRAHQLAMTSHLGRSLVTTPLARALQCRYEISGVTADLDKAIQLYEDSVSSTPIGSPSRVRHLNCLGSSLLLRAQNQEQADDAALAAKLHEEALGISRDRQFPFLSIIHRLLPLSTRKFVLSWMNRDLLSSFRGLAMALTEHSRMVEDRVEMQKAISYHEQVLHLGSSDHPDHFDHLVGLASALHTSFLTFEDPEDLRRSLDAFRLTLELSPPGHPDRFAATSNVGRVCREYFAYSGAVSDLDESISLLTEAVSLQPENYDPHLGLADSILRRHKELGSEEDVEHAIRLYGDALLRCRQGGQEYYEVLHHLAMAYASQHLLRGDIEVLEKAIQLSRTVIVGGAQGDRCSAMLNLANSLMARFQFRNYIEDLDESIETYEQALQLCKAGSRQWALAAVPLAAAFLSRYGVIYRNSDLKNAYQLASAAFELPARYTDRPAVAAVFADVLFLRYHRFREAADLDKAIQVLSETLDATPAKYSGRPRLMELLAGNMSVRYSNSREISDLSATIQLYRDALESSIPRRGLAQTIRNLADSLLSRYELTNDEHDLRAALELYPRAIGDPHSVHAQRLAATMAWVEATRKYDPGALSSVYSTAVASLVFATFDRPRMDLKGIFWSQLAHDAAAHALTVSDPNKAVELLEQGRAIMWSLMYKIPPSTPHVADPKKQFSPQSFKPEDLGRHRGDHVEETFLRPFADLVVVSKRGPVVILLASQNHGCGAILIRSPEHDAEHIRLPNVTTGSVIQMSTQFQRIAEIGSRDANYIPNEEELETIGLERKMAYKTIRVQASQDELEVVLSRIWDDIACPIIKALGVQKADGRLRPRLWWCPTGYFESLPIHAAGIRFRRADSESLDDYVVSSYIPTLGTLSRARAAFDDTDLRPLLHMKALALAQPTTPGLPSLPNAAGELDLLQKVLPDKMLLRLHEGASDDLSSTNTHVLVSQVLQKLPEASILHCACHGDSPDFMNPRGHGFFLEDGKLTAEQLMNLHLPYAVFAFLSACHTAEGDTVMSVNPGTLLLSAGFKTVIGTMWPMNDRDGPIVANTVYGQLLKSDAFDPDIIAYALHEAVRSLRDRSVPPSRWAPYIHLGI
ncbi:hypothetical protein JAAARDRAFT_160927 [Jaapia argillacea MUCL 33604]|uniref:CHAT domain-containing protein n=1 Tax=Jaapia argillacea MUCL 33604 TaxID=933084 RepID=A0A067PHM0_9AGAM|nr:hypothetical protein JAAARDRAFT_160927 [Jaapia argillacea MUCL 33604]